MKLFYKDEKNKKRLIAESDNLLDIVHAAEEDAKSKFIMLGKVSIRNGIFKKKDGTPSGYYFEKDNPA